MHAYTFDSFRQLPLSFYTSYSDDLDKATGELDENIHKFDEILLIEKHEQVLSLGQKLWDDNKEDVVKWAQDKENCASLLRRFHRTIEKDDVPDWEGGTVSQVCLAEV